MKIDNLNITEGLSFDDVLVIPAYSEIIPKHVQTRTRLAGNITLNVPILSAAMDTVTEDDLAIALALEGGAGVLHMNLKPEEQARQVGRVKRYLNWIIDRPVTVEKTDTVKQAMALMEKHGISGVLIVHQGKLVGILTRRDLRFLDNPEKKVEEVMTSKLITENESVNISSAQGWKFNAHRIEKLPVVDSEGRLVGPHYGEGHREAQEVPGRRPRQEGPPHRGGRGLAFRRPGAPAAPRGKHGRFRGGGHGPRPFQGRH